MIILMSIPLIFRRVPMNSFYGVRFAQSFKSDAAWYSINEYGGKALLFSAFPILIYGIWGQIEQPSHYFVTATLLMVISIVTACVLSYVKARKIDKQNG
ncbi:MAG: SdpI family protein [Spartobacteria bacterium]